MNDKVLSEGEIDALTQPEGGVREQVVSRTGTREMDVIPFEIEPRSHFRFGSYPELQRLNEKSAVAVQQYLRGTLKWPVTCTLVHQTEAPISRWLDQFAGLQLCLEYQVEPLQGQVYFMPDIGLTCALVEVLFGSVIIPETPDNPERFSQGQMRIAQRFADRVLAIIADIWMPVVQTSYQFAQAEQSIDRVAVGTPRDRAIVSTFRIDGEEFSAQFATLYPCETLSPLLDRLDGAERSHSQERNHHWAKCMEQHVRALPIRISARNKPSRISLGALRALDKGQILPIQQPEAVDLYCGNRRLSAARFGTNQGKNCIQLQQNLLTKTPQIGAIA